MGSASDQSHRPSHPEGDLADVLRYVGYSMMSLYVTFIALKYTLNIIIS